MDKGVIMLLWFVRSTIVVLGTVTAATAIHSSHRKDGLVHQDRYNRNSDLQHDFVFNERDLGEAEFASSASMDAEKRDVEALLSFKKALTSDPTGSLSNWTADNSENVCQWTGISCRKHTKRVVAIILPGLFLSGVLSPFLGNLSLLRTLNLSLTSLTGRIPTEFGQLKALEILDLSFIFGLSGQIPPSLGNCGRLQTIILSANNLTGRIPYWSLAYCPI